MIRRSTGFTLVEVMIGVGIVAVLGLSIAIIFGNISRLAAKPDAIVSAQVIRQIANLALKNPSLCDHALRTAGSPGGVPTMTSGPTPYDIFPVGTPATGATASIDHINYYDPARPGSDVTTIQTGTTRVGQNMYVKSIDFYETIPGQNRSATMANGVPYTVYNGFIVIRFGEGYKAPPPSPSPTSIPAGKILSGGVVPPEKIPIVLAARTSGGSIDFCYGNASFVDACNAAGGTINPATGNCTSTINVNFENSHCPPTGAPPCPPAGIPFPGTGVWGFDTFDQSTGHFNCTCIQVNKAN